MANLEVNTEIIKDVIPIYPDLISEGYKDIIIEKYNDIINTQNSIYELREIIRNSENDLKEKKEDFDKITTMFKIVFETKSFESIEASELDKAMHRKGKIYQ